MYTMVDLQTEGQKQAKVALEQDTIGHLGPDLLKSSTSHRQSTGPTMP